jgi:hypothetical protein
MRSVADFSSPVHVRFVVQRVAQRRASLHQCFSRNFISSEGRKEQRLEDLITQYFRHRWALGTKALSLNRRTLGHGIHWVWTALLRSPVIRILCPLSLSRCMQSARIVIFCRRFCYKLSTFSPFYWTVALLHYRLNPQQMNNETANINIKCFPFIPLLPQETCAAASPYHVQAAAWVQFASTVQASITPATGGNTAFTWKHRRKSW